MSQSPRRRLPRCLLPLVMCLPTMVPASMWMLVIPESRSRSLPAFQSHAVHSPPSVPERLPLQRQQIHEENDQCDGHNAGNNVCALPTVLDGLAQISPTVYVVELNHNPFQTCLRPLQFGIQKLIR